MTTPSAAPLEVRAWLKEIHVYTTFILSLFFKMHFTTKILESAVPYYGL